MYKLDIGCLHYRTLFWFNQEQRWKLREDMQRLFRIKALHRSCNETSVVTSFHFIKRLDIVLASFLRLYTMSYVWIHYHHFGFIIFTKMKFEMTIKKLTFAFGNVCILKHYLNNLLVQNVKKEAFGRTKETNFSTFYWKSSTDRNWQCRFLILIYYKKGKINL